MRYFPLLVLILMLSASPAFADWDAEGEAREQAERDAQERARQEAERENKKNQDEARAKYGREVLNSKREALGAAANGKTDAEISALYDAKIKADTEQGMRAYQQGREALSHGAGADAVKNVTGKTLQELENMTDEEAEALSRELEKKYGN